MYTETIPAAQPTPDTTATATHQAIAHARHAIRSAWRATSRARQTTAAQHAALAILLGIPLDKAFTPITNPKKLANGARPHQGRDAALNQALSGHAPTWSVWASLLAPIEPNTQRWGVYYDFASHPFFGPALDAIACMQQGRLPGTGASP